MSAFYSAFFLFSLVLSGSVFAGKVSTEDLFQSYRVTSSWSRKLGLTEKNGPETIDYVAVNWGSDDLLTGYWMQHGLQGVNPPGKFEAVFEGGLVKKLSVAKSADVWQVEFIRAVVSLLQISERAKREESFSLMEETVTGKCKTLYTVGSGSEESSNDISNNNINILKSRNMTDCQSLPFFQRGIFGESNWKAIFQSDGILERTEETKVTMSDVQNSWSIVSSRALSEISVDDGVKVSSRIELEAVSLAPVFEEDTEMVEVGGLMFRSADEKPAGYSLNNKLNQFSREYYMNPEHLHRSRKVDQVEMVEDILRKIEQDMKDPGEIPRFNTLDRYSVLVHAVRDMNVEDMTRIYTEMMGPQDGPVQESQVNIYVAALTDCGTLPCLQMLRHNIYWRTENIQETDLLEAPRKANPLTMEYLEEFYAIVRSLENRTDKAELYAESLLAFSNLLRRFLTEKDPIFTTSHLEMRLRREFMPYLSSLVKPGQDDDMLQICIRSLGNVGYPKIIHTFQQLLRSEEVKLVHKVFMIQSMDKLIELHTSSARRFLFSTFLDDEMSTTVRVAALHQLLKTDPPRSMIKAVFKAAKSADSSETLLPTVVSSLQSPAYKWHADNQLQEQMQNMEPSNQTKSFIKRMVTEEGEDIVSDILQEVIVSMDKKAGLFSSLTYHQDSSWRGLRETFSANFMMDNLADFLKSLKGELWYWGRGSMGNILIDYDFYQLLFPFHGLQGRALTRFWAHAFSSRKLEMTTFGMEEKTVAFPTVTGQPFMCAIETPGVTFLNADLSVRRSLWARTTVSLNGHGVYSSRDQKKFGLVDPSSGLWHVAGIDRNQHLSIPLSLDIKMPLKRFIMTLQPNMIDEKERILHTSTWPYFSDRSLFPSVPTAEDPSTDNIIPEEILVEESVIEDNTRLRLRLKGDLSQSYDALNEEKNQFWKDDHFEMKSLEHRILNIFMEKTNNDTNVLVVNLDFNNQLRLNLEDSVVENQFFQGDIQLTGQTERSISMMGTMSGDSAIQVTFNAEAESNGTSVYRVTMNNEINVFREELASVHSKLQFGPPDSNVSSVSVLAEWEHGDEYKTVNMTIEHSELPPVMEEEMCKLPESGTVNTHQGVCNYVFATKYMCSNQDD